MAFQVILDSISRCFGAPIDGVSSTTHTTDVNTNKVGPTENGQRGKNPSSNRRSRNRNVDPEVIQSRRRQGRALGLELHDQEWDALFHRDATAAAASSTGKKNRSQNRNDQSPADKMRRRTNGSTTTDADKSRSNNNASSPPEKKLDMDIGYAEVLAKAKEAARPARHATPRKSHDRKADIFRSRKSPNASFTSRILGKDGVAKALCFANPVHDHTVDAEDKMPSDRSVADTLDTTDDTITSTMYFEAKFNPAMETRPPMPLFTQYKVECNDWRGNALMGIVASGSHQSIHMLQLRDDDGTSRRLFVAADGLKDKTDDIVIADVEDIQLTDSEDSLDDDENYQNTPTNNKRDKSSRGSPSLALDNDYIIDSTTIITKTHADSSPPPVKPISGSQSTAYSSSGSSRSNSFGQGHVRTENQNIVTM